MSIQPPSLPPKAIEREARKLDKAEKLKKASRREQKAARQRWLINMLLAFVFAIMSVGALFSFGPSFSDFSGDHPGPTASASQNPEQAELEAAQKAVAASPDATNEFELGEALYKQTKWEQAADAYHKALALEPNNVMAMSHLGAVLLNQGKVSDALPILEKAQATEKEQQALQSSPTPASSDCPDDAVDASTTKDINIPERLYQAYTMEKQRDKAVTALGEAKDIDLLHTLEFLLRQSASTYVEQNDKVTSQQELDDATTASAHIAPKFKDELYQEMVLTAILGAGMDKTHPEQGPRAKAWVNMLGESLQKTDPEMAKKIGDLIKQLNNPPKVATSGAPPPASQASGSPTKTTVTMPQPGKPVVIESTVIDMSSESPSPPSP
ncbi:MAG TPA: tetratricopeptide repeat protein [Candidatus Xenobia bacterium]